MNNDVFFTVSDNVVIDGINDYDIYRGNGIKLSDRFNPFLFDVNMDADVTYFVEGEDAELVTDKVFFRAVVENFKVVRVDWSVYKSDCDYGVLCVEDGELAFNHTVTGERLNMIFFDIRAFAAVNVINELNERNNTTMNLVI